MDVSTAEPTDVVQGTTKGTPLPEGTPDNGPTTSKVRLLKKAVRMLADQGPAFTLRRAIWRLHYERFERQRKQLAGHLQMPIVPFLGNDFELHRSNEGVSEELRLFGVHEPSATSAYLQHLSPGDHVIDVGSNLGYYLLLAARRIGSSGRLLGFEPAPGVYEILERNVGRSGHKNIQVAPWAIGAKSGTLQFYESEVPNWGSVFQNSRLQQTRATTVQVKTLDEVVRDTAGFHPKALRMDVEGAELMVLEGAREVLQRYKPCLFIEFHNFAVGWDAVRAAIIDLGRLGYSSGVLIERTWDQPWMSQWMRKRRCWTGAIDSLLARVESPSNPLVASTLIFILTAR
jgi:FkbM family methyltransferase